MTWNARLSSECLGCTIETSAAQLRPSASRVPHSTGGCRSMGSERFDLGLGRFGAGVLLRIATLFLTIVLAAWLITNTHWYMTIALCGAAAFAETVLLIRFATQSGREVARFLDALAVDDPSQTFSTLNNDPAQRELGAAMARVMAQLHATRSEREEQSGYLRTILAHVPVALVSMDE